MFLPPHLFDSKEEKRPFLNRSRRVLFVFFFKASGIVMNVMIAWCWVVDGVLLGCLLTTTLGRGEYG